MDIISFFKNKNNQIKLQTSPKNIKINNYLVKIKKHLESNTINETEHELLTKILNNGSLVDLTEANAILNRLNDQDIIKIFNELVPEAKLANTKLLPELFSSGNFNEDQIKATEKIFNFLIDRKKKLFGLFGRAGTGKTSKPVELILFLLKQNLIQSVAFVAATNQAVTVMKSKFYANNHDFAPESVEFLTIHKLLQYESDIDVKSGSKIFVKNNKKNKKSKLEKYDLIIIDECSMVIKQVVDFIESDCQNNKKAIKIIFIGDECQLNPVHEESSPIFTRDILDDRALLTQVMRTKKQAIIDLCNSVRKWVSGESKTTGLANFRNKEKDSVFLYQKLATINKTKSKWFDSFAKNENAIILTWTNKQSNIYNTIMRQKMFGKVNLEKFEIHDKLIMKDFYAYDDTGNQPIKFYTSEQILVKDCDTINKYFVGFQENFPDKAKQIRQSLHIEAKYINTIRTLNKNTQRSYKLWQLTVKKIAIQSDNTSTIYIINDDSLELLTKEKNYVQSKLHLLWEYYRENFKGSKTQIEKFVMKPLWKEYHKIFVDPFASVNYGISATVHVGQGSNYSKVYVDADDILNNQNESEAKKCIYTALTRAVDELHILI